MTARGNCGRSAIVLVLFFVGLLVSSNRAFASGNYRIWYYDYDEWYAYGDVSVGDDKYTPPAWACSIKFYSPYYYDWVDNTGGSNGSDNFDHDVRVYLPRPGCPDQEIIVMDGNTEIPYELGSPYLDIFTDYGFSWLDANGSNHACGFGCATAPIGFNYVSYKFAIEALAKSLHTADTRTFVLRDRSVADSPLSELRDRLAQLDAEIRRQITGRRRYAMGDREASVRAMEDAALARLGEARRRLIDCEGFAAQSQFNAAFVAGELGRDSVTAVQMLLQAAESSFTPRSQ